MESCFVTKTFYLDSFHFSTGQLNISGVLPGSRTGSLLNVFWNLFNFIKRFQQRWTALLPTTWYQNHFFNRLCSNSPWQTRHNRCLRRVERKMMIASCLSSSINTPKQNSQHYVFYAKTLKHSRDSKNILIHPLLVWIKAVWQYRWVIWAYCPTLHCPILLLPRSLTWLRNCNAKK